MPRLVSPTLRGSLRGCCRQACRSPHGVCPRGLSRPRCLATATIGDTGSSSIFELSSTSRAAQRQQQQEQQQQEQQFQEQELSASATLTLESAPPPADPLHHAHLNASSPAAASLSRVLLVGQPVTMFRNLSSQGRLPVVSGPLSLLLFLVGLLVAVLAAIRGLLVRRVRSCLACHGYGIVRCRLCSGNGFVDWQAKFRYSDVCPLCTTKRFITCSDCGGFHVRPLFQHDRPVNRKPNEDPFGEAPASRNIPYVE